MKIRAGTALAAVFIVALPFVLTDSSSSSIQRVSAGMAEPQKDVAINANSQQTLTGPNALRQFAQQKGIEKFTRSHELLTMDPIRVADDVARTGRLSIVTSKHVFDLELVPNDMRAATYRAEEVVAGGNVRSIPMGGVHTYKGILRGVAGAFARFTIAADTIEGTISMRDEKYFIEPLKRYSSGAVNANFVIYSASDVIDPGTLMCGVTLDSKLSSALNSIDLRGNASSAEPEVFSPRAAVELATEADYDFVTMLGGSTQANNEILSIMNQVDGIYEAEIGLNFKISYQHTWATTSDPYNSTNPTTALAEFRNYWNANLTSVSRDGAYLWTGRNVGAAGIAYVGAICNSTTFAYGLTNGTIASYYKITTTAHEIGHNLGAAHADEIPSPDVGCYKTIMWSYADALISLPTFCQYSEDQITSFISSNNCSLFNNISGEVKDAKGNRISGVTVALTGTQSATSQTDFAGKYILGHLALNGTYTVTPTKDNYSFSPGSHVINNYAGAQTVNFTATPASFFNISGRLTTSAGSGLANVTMTLSGSQLNTVQTDSSGNYKFENVGAGGTHIVAPPRVGYAFSPSSETFSNIASDQSGVDFTGSEVLYPIQGRVFVSSSTTPINGVTVTVTGDRSATTTTDNNGTFSLGLFPAFGNYTVYLSKVGYSFQPPRLNFFNLSSGQDCTFYGFQFSTISNVVLDDLSAPISGVTVTLSGSRSATVQTDSTGTFTFPDLPVTGPYTLTPAKAGYNFLPTSRTVSQLGVLEGNYFFRGTPLYSVNGKIATASGIGVGEVSINLIGTQATTYSVESDQSGNYNFTKTPPPDTYTVVPSKLGYSFTPDIKTISTLFAQQMVDFSAATLPTPVPTPFPTPRPLVPATNGKIAFSTQRNGRPEIFVMNADGSTQTRVTTLGSDFYPTWSPSGSRLLFVRVQNNQSDLYAVNADGSNLERLTTDVSFDSYPTWSPDGGRIAFASGRSNSQQYGKIYVMNADGTNPVRITPNNLTDDVGPSWSPDGTKIAFVSYRDGNYEIYTINPDGTNVSRLTNNAENDWGPSWSPDSTKIVFYSGRNGRDEIFVMNADGSGEARLTTSSYWDRDPTWAPDGNKIAFVTLRTDPTFQGGVVVMNADGTNQTLVLNEFTVTNLSWQPVTATPTPTPTPTLTPTGTPTPAPMTVQFTSGMANVTETLNGTTKAVLTVTRTGATSGDAAVNYASSDVTATDRSDYLAALGTLRFAANETSKTITIFIVDDRFGEGPETFNVDLRNPIGCTLGTPSSLTVTINSNENVNGLNPVKNASFDTDFFVRQHYLDFFNRAPDAGGLAFWKNQIDSCTTQSCREIRRINVSAAFFVSIEFQETGYLVYKACQAAFNSGEFLKLRDFLPDLQEIGRGVVFGQPGADAQLEANKVAFFNSFVQRPAFLAPGNYPITMTAAQFVDKLNANTFNPQIPGSTGALTLAQRNTLVAELAANPSSPALRAAALRAIAQNSIFSTRQFNKAFVLMQYFGYLRRNPNDPPELGLDFAGYNFWLTKLNQFHGNYITAEMVNAFIVSSEYQLRFGP